MFNPTTLISQYYPWPRNLLFPFEKEGLKRYAKNRKNIIEIGVFEGASACILKKSMHPDGNLYLIDPFIPDSMNPKIKARKWITKLNLKLTYPFFRNVFLIEKKSTDDSLKFQKKIDFLFIDGDHSEVGTSADWIKYSRLVKSKGIIALHDSFDFSYHYYPAKGHIGPIKLRNKLLSSKYYDLIDTCGTISFFQKR